MTAAVELRDVFCVHRTNEGDAAALQGMNLEVSPEEIVCVLGPSGAGKSTLLRVIAGLQLPSAGVVNVLGTDVGRLGGRARARIRNRSLGFLGQRADEALSPALPARAALALPLALRGVDGPERVRRIGELLETAGLADRGDALAVELSGGERQRLALCAALAHAPALLLADEPTGELDDRAADGVRRLIVELARRERASVVLVSHDPGMTNFADRTVSIRDGRVVEDGRDGGTALVIGAGGWLRLPAGLLSDAGIARRVRARPVPGGVLISAAPGESATAPARPQRGAEPVAWTPARVALHSVSRSYRQGAGERTVLDELAHEFVPGRMTAVTGRSGSGKTTLLRLIAGLDRPDAGALTIDEQPVDELDAEQLAAVRRRRIGYLPQEPAPVAFLSAEENVALVLRARGWDAPAATGRARAVLARVGLAERAGQRVSRLSAGETQRVALARALAGARGLLIVDEPTSRLDEATAGEVAGLLAAAAAEDEQTVICATHDPAVIDLADAELALEVGARAATARAATARPRRAADRPWPPRSTTR
jgi:ABC-type lipoprotein export system ATPase subunit